MHWIDWLIVLVINGAIIGYGFYLARGTETSSEWFLGKRALPWWGIGLSMFATNVDNADLVSVSGKTFKDGLHILTVYALGSGVGGILSGFFVAPAMYRAGCYTNAEYLEARYGVVTRILSALIQIQYRSSMLGLMIWSVYKLLIGMEIVEPVAAWVLILTLVICSGIYTSLGGLKSVVWTDAFQSLVMMAAGIAIFFVVWHAVGGWDGMETNLQTYGSELKKPLSDLPHIGKYDGGDQHTSPYQLSLPGGSINLGPYVVVLAWIIVASGYWTVNHTQTMRLMGARSLWDMKMAAIAGVIFSLPIMIATSCLGIFGRAHPEFQDLTDSDELYPLMAKLFLDTGFKGLVVAGVVAAAVSTFDSMGSALSAVFTRDIYARWIRSNGSDHHYVRVGRWATVAVLLLGFAYLPFIIMQKNMLDAFTTLIPVFVTPLLTIYVLGVLTPVHRSSGLPGLLCGSLYGLVALYEREAPKITFLPDLHLLPGWLSDRWGAAVWSFLITSVAVISYSRLFGSAEEDKIAEVKHPGWLERSREELPELREHPFSGQPSWWLNPNLYGFLMILITGYVVFGLFW